MPQVPIQTTPTVSPSGGRMPYIQPAGGTPPMMDGTASKQLQQTGAALQDASKVLARIQDRIDDTKVKQATLAYSIKVKDLNTKFLATEGTNTLDGFKEYQESISGAADEFAGMLGNDRQRLMFSAVQQKYGSDAMALGTSHMLKQQHAVDLGTAQSLYISLADTAARTYNLDQNMSAARMKEGLDQVDAFANLSGFSPEQTDLLRLKYTSGVHEAIATMMLDNHELGRVGRYLEANKDGMLAEKYNDLKSKVKDAINVHNYTVETARLWEKNGGDYEKTLNDIAGMPIEKRLKMRTALTHMWNNAQAAEQIRDEAHAQNFSRAIDEYQQTGTVSPTLFASLSDDEQLAVTTKPPEINNPSAVAEVMEYMEMGGKAWTNFQKGRLPLLRGKLTPEAFARFSQISNPSELTSVVYDHKMFINALNTVGLSGIAYPEAGSENAKRQALIEKEFGDRILAEQVATGKPLSRAEKEGILTRMLEPVIEDDAYKWTWWGDTSRRLWQVKITDIPDKEKTYLREQLKAANALRTDEAYNERLIIDTWVKLKQGAR